MDKKRILKMSISIIAIFMSLFHIYYSRFGFITEMKYRSFHLMFAMVLIFLIYPISKKKGTNKARIPNPIDLICIILSILVGLYMICEEYNIGLRMGLPTFSDTLLGCIAIILTLEIGRRSVGLPLVIVALAFLLYGLFGNYMPGPLSHRGYEFGRIVTTMYLYTDGIYGTPTGVVASMVIFFIIFGAFLEKSGGSDFFVNVASALTGKMRGGPAKISVVSSGFFGMISGSAAANVMVDGAITITMMKKTGYKPAVAGAIEAAASSGGYIMPPVMGAAVFLLCEFTGESYFEIVKISIIPAIIYYISLYSFVHFEACRYNIMGVETGGLKSLWKILVTGLHFIVGVLVMSYFLVMQYSPGFAGLMGSLSIVIVSLLKKRMGFMDILGALELGARNCVMITAACACAGIIIGIISLTGVGLVFSHLILSFSYGKLYMAMILSMFIAVLLSMTLTIAADYIIMAVLAAPALVLLGLDLVTAHLIVLWFCCYSNLTPPVAIASYAAAGIANADPMKTALYGARAGKAFIIIPYTFAYLPILSGSVWEIIRAGIMIAIGLVCLEASFAGYLVRIATVFERTLLVIVVIFSFWPNALLNLVAIGLLLLIILKQKYSVKLNKNFVVDMKKVKKVNVLDEK